jgi:ubiquinone/menaquinone biosynthesis C-methylase UbiE
MALDGCVTTTDHGLPFWACSELVAPDGDRPPRQRDGLLIDASSKPIACIDTGVIRFTLEPNGAVEYYRSVGGAHFHERSGMSCSMSALDTPVYRNYLEKIAPSDREALIVDIGGGDGRNALPWLEWGYKRVVVVDPAAAALCRFRDRVAAQNRAWLDRILLIECDARDLPLRTASAELVLAIESLYYLNEDYELGIRECKRVMSPSGRLLLSDRDYEGALLTKLLYYGGIPAVLEMATSREMWDGEGARRVRSRCFTREEMIAVVQHEGLQVVEAYGISMFSLLVSFLSKQDPTSAPVGASLEKLNNLLCMLGHEGSARRCNVLILSHKLAEKIEPVLPE